MFHILNVVQLSKLISCTLKAFNFTIIKCILIFFNGSKKKGRQLKKSSRDSKNSSLGSSEGDGVITWKGYMTQIEAAGTDGVQPPGGAQKPALSAPSLLLPSLPVTGSGLDQHPRNWPLHKGIQGIWREPDSQQSPTSVSLTCIKSNILKQKKILPVEEFPGVRFDTC